MWWLWDHQGGGAPHIPEEVRWGTSKSWVPSLLQSVEVGLQPRPSLPSWDGPLPHNSQFKARPSQEMGEGLLCLPKLLFLAAAWLPGVTGAGSGCLHGNWRYSSPLSL